MNAHTMVSDCRISTQFLPKDPIATFILATSLVSVDQF